MCFYCLLVLQTASDFMKHIEVCDTFGVNEIICFDWRFGIVVTSFVAGTKLLYVKRS